MTEHTPTPWHVYFTEADAAFIVRAASKPVAELSVEGGTRYGCAALLEAIGDFECCSSCHSEMDAWWEGEIDCYHGQDGEVGGVTFEGICCGGTQALRAKLEEAQDANESEVCFNCGNRRGQRHAVRCELSGEVATGNGVREEAQDE